MHLSPVRPTGLIAQQFSTFLVPAFEILQPDTSWRWKMSLEIFRKIISDWKCDFLFPLPRWNVFNLSTATNSFFFVFSWLLSHVFSFSFSWIARLRLMIDNLKRIYRSHPPGDIFKFLSERKPREPVAEAIPSRGEFSWFEMNFRDSMNKWIMGGQERHWDGCFTYFTSQSDLSSVGCIWTAAISAHFTFELTGSLSTLNFQNF